MPTPAAERTAPTPDPQRLVARLRDAFPRSSGYWVGYSGGLDSTVLLSLLAAARDQLPAALHAVHVDHGLQPGAAVWAEHCRATCAALGVPLVTQRVDARPARGESPEAAARRARYRALAASIGDGGMLLTAHHRDDQAETLLLQLLRGAGVAGLAAMPACRRLGAGWHARPLLEVPRAALRRWAETHGVTWIDDPSNARTDADRNFLRHRVLPLLGERWPGAAAALARSARHCAEAATVLETVDRAALAEVAAGDGARLSVARLCALPPARRGDLLRAWLRQRGTPPPPARRLAEALDQLCHARADATPAVAWAGVALRRYRDAVWLVPDPLPAPPTGPIDWDGEALDLGAGRGQLERRLAPGGVDPVHWSRGRVRVGFRGDGLVLRPAGRHGSRSFKKLAQEHGIPPWQRALLPVLLIDGQPAAVANCCTCEPFAAPPGNSGWYLHWTPAGPTDNAG